MQRKFLTNLGLMLFLNLLVKPVWIFAIDRNVQNVVGAMDYGFYFDLLNFSFLFNILLDLGITNFNNRNIAQNQQLLNKHFSAIVVMKFLLALVYIIIAFGVAFLMKYKADQMRLLVWLAFNQILTSFILYLRSNVSGLLMFKTDSILSVLDRILMILFCSILLWGHITASKFRIEWPVEYEPEMVLGMLCRDPFQRFKSKPTDSFKFIFDQQTGIDSNVHQASKI